MFATHWYSCIQLNVEFDQRTPCKIQEHLTAWEMYPEYSSFS